MALCDTDSPIPYVHIGIPANNMGTNIIGCLFWILARMVLQMLGIILLTHKSDGMVDLFFYRKLTKPRIRKHIRVLLQWPILVLLVGFLMINGVAMPNGGTQDKCCYSYQREHEQFSRR